MNGVIILTHTKSCFTSIIEENYNLLTSHNIDVIICENGDPSQYEMLGIKTGMLHFDEFVLLQDSVKLYEVSFIKQMFEYKNKSVFLSSWGQNYFGKYLTRILIQLKLPTINNKKDSVYYEREFFKQYCAIEKPIIILDGCLENTNKFEFSFNRNNMIIENKYFKKYKGTWDVNQI